MAVQGDYVDGFLLAVPNDKKTEYIEQAETFARVMRKYGLLEYVESWGDDLPEGKVNSFHTAVIRKDNENVVFSFCTWPDKETRDKGWEEAMKDPELQMDPADMPWDGKRMIWGGFKKIVG